MKKDSAVSIWISGAGSFFIANSVYSHQKYYENVKKLLKYLLKFIIIYYILNYRKIYHPANAHFFRNTVEKQSLLVYYAYMWGYR